VTEPVAVAGSVAVSVTGRPSTKEERGVERVNEGAEVEDARTEKVLVMDGTGSKAALPAWEAASVQVPMLTSVRTPEA